MKATRKTTPKDLAKLTHRSEASIQSEFIRTVHELFPQLPDKLLFAVPNGGSRDEREAANLVRQGVKKGVADVILQIPKKGYATLCLEFKTPVGRQSPDQKEYQRQVEMAGSKYVIVRSVAEAIEAVRAYLK